MAAHGINEAEDKDAFASKPAASMRSRTPEEALFHVETGAGQKIHPKMLQAARKTGQLNLSGRGLVAVPEKVWNINDMDEEEKGKASKGFSMDRVRVLSGITGSS